MSKTNFTRKYKESKHLTLVERKILFNMLREAKRCEKKKRPFMSKRTIARILGVSPQTVLNEIKKDLMKSKKELLKLKKRLIIKLIIKMNTVQSMDNMYTKQIV